MAQSPINRPIWSHWSSPIIVFCWSLTQVPTFFLIEHKQTIGSSGVRTHGHTFTNSYIRTVPMLFLSISTTVNSGWWSTTSSSSSSMHRFSHHIQLQHLLFLSFLRKCFCISTLYEMKLLCQRERKKERERDKKGPDEKWGLSTTTSPNKFIRRCV